MTTAQPLNLAAPIFAISAEGGNDVTFVVKFPYDATAGTHTLLFAESPDGASIAAYASGSGLTIGVYAGGITPVTALLPRSMTRTYRKRTLYFSYQLELSSTLRTQAKGTMVLEGDIYVADP